MNSVAQKRLISRHSPTLPLWWKLFGKVALWPLPQLTKSVCSNMIGWRCWRAWQENGCKRSVWRTRRRAWSKSTTKSTIQTVNYGLKTGDHLLVCHEHLLWVNMFHYQSIQCNIESSIIGNKKQHEATVEKNIVSKNCVWRDQPTHRKDNKSKNKASSKSSSSNRSRSNNNDNNNNNNNNNKNSSSNSNSNNNNNDDDDNDTDNSTKTTTLTTTAPVATRTLRTRTTRNNNQNHNMT